MTNWVLKDKETGETILETSENGSKFTLLDTERYEMVSVPQPLLKPIIIVDIESIAERNKPKEYHISIITNHQQIEATIISILNKLPWDISYDLGLNHTNGTMTIKPKMIYSDNVTTLEWVNRARVNAARLISALARENLPFKLKENGSQ